MERKIQRIELSTGVRLEYAETGDRQGAAVLLLHGLSDSWRSYELLLSELPQSFRALALSQRGHGESSRFEREYRCGHFAGDAAALLDALDIDEAIVVGHSMGSAVAQKFAIDHPERTAGLVLASPFYSMARSEAPKELWAMIESMDDPVDPGFIREFQGSTIVEPVPEAFFETIVEESQKLSADTWRAIVRCNIEDDFSDRLGEIEAPTLLVWGSRDETCPRPEQEALLDAIPNARLTVYEGAGHALPWERPAQLVSDLEAFADEILR